MKSNRLSPVELAARNWWRMHRPLSFSHKQHLANPTVNLSYSHNHRLARAVAKTYASK